MKKISRILSLVLAVCLISVCFTVNVMAASTVHTLGISASKTEALTAGETIVVEVTIDNTLNLVNVDYDLVYDTDAFEVDTTLVSRLAAFIDKDWHDAIKDTDGDWGYYMNGAPTINGAEAGTIYFRAAGGANGGVEADYAVDNRVIGKYNIKVKADAPNGTYEFKVVNGKTGDAGETLTAAMEPVSISVTVGEEAPPVITPVVNDVVAGDTDGVAIEGTDKKYDNAFAVTASFTNAGSITGAGVLFIPKAVLGDAELTAATTDVANAYKAGAAVGEGTLTIKAAIKSIPRVLEGTDLVMVTRPYVLVDTAYTYGNAAETTINFGDTGEVE